MTLSLTCADGPLFEPVGIEVSDLSPGEHIRIELRFRDAANVDWISQATFVSSADGTVHTDTHPAVSGDYVGVDPHGLFWSARPDDHRDLPQRILKGAARTLMPQMDALAAYHWDVIVETEARGRLTTQIIRRRLNKRIASSQPPAPLQGIVFTPEIYNGASILVLGGSEGGLFPARAALLAASGFRTFALAYFQHPGCPSVGRNLPLEYFRDALDWLKADGGPVGMIGVSRGSEAAQLSAIEWPSLVDALVLWVPSHLANRGLDLVGGEDFRRESSAMWMLNGSPIPGVGFLEDDVRATTERNQDFSSVSGRRYAEEFSRAWAATGTDHRIAIENYPGPVLSVAGKEDALWPSARGANEITRAKSARSGIRELERYENAGHLIGTPNEPRPYPWLMHWAGGYMGIDNGFCAYGGTREGAAIAARASWQRQTEFLLSHLT